MGWIGAAFLLWGRDLIGKDKVRKGLCMSMVGDTIWAIVGWQTGNLPLAFTGAVMAVWDIKGWYNEGKKDSYLQSMLLPEYKRKWWHIWK